LLKLNKFNNVKREIINVNLKYTLFCNLLKDHIEEKCKSVLNNAFDVLNKGMGKKIAV